MGTIVAMALASDRERRYATAKDLATTTVFLSTTLSLASVAIVLYLLQGLG